MMTPKLKINLATKLLALVAASCALATGGRAPQTAGESNREGAARLAQRCDTTLRESGILMGDKTAGSGAASLSVGNVCVK